jgi:hypothetical protein
LEEYLEEQQSANLNRPRLVGLLILLLLVLKRPIVQPFDQNNMIYYRKLHVITVRPADLFAGELSDNSLILEIFVSASEKIRQVFLLNAYML